MCGLSLRLNSCTPGLSLRLNSRVEGMKVLLPTPNVEECPRGDLGALPRSGGLRGAPSVVGESAEPIDRQTPLVPNDGQRRRADRAAPT